MLTAILLIIGIANLVLLARVYRMLRNIEEGVEDIEDCTCYVKRH